MRFELMTSSLPRKRSTPELQRQNYLSGKRDSNSRPSAWKADALSTELFPHITSLYDYKDVNFTVGRAGFEPTKTKSAELQSAPVGHFGIFPNCNIYERTFSLYCDANIDALPKYTSLPEIFFR